VRQRSKANGGDGRRRRRRWRRQRRQRAGGRSHGRRRRGARARAPAMVPAPHGTSQPRAYWLPSRMPHGRASSSPGGGAPPLPQPSASRGSVCRLPGGGGCCCCVARGGGGASAARRRRGAHCAGCAPPPAAAAAQGQARLQAGEALLLLREGSAVQARRARSWVLAGKALSARPPAAAADVAMAGRCALRAPTERVGGGRAGRVRALRRRLQHRALELCALSSRRASRSLSPPHTSCDSSNSISAVVRLCSPPAIQVV